MAVSPDNYFAFWDILLYDVVGDIWLLIIIGLIVIVILAAKYRLPQSTTILISLLYLMVITGIMFNQIIWVFVVLAVGGLAYYLISKVWKRG